ncbi:hypothetical protein BASA81_007431 [Batrachochytrium salamandrivorans]|nr:hypothetical protein BASA81_007431 [Batrachochytrium salamandrivorans]
MPLGPAQPIRFTVRKSSPCVPGFPPSELEVQSVNTKGYQTYLSPGELVLELVGGGKFDLAELQVLSHESKIASRIEVSVQLLGQSGFQTLGYLEFEDNARSGYLARELQSVRINCSSATHVRLVLHAAHGNSELNPQGHVGIIGMNLLGWKRQHEASLSNASFVIAPSSSFSAPTAQSLHEPQSNSVAALLAKVGELKRAKESAVAREAYDEALQLKNEELEAGRLAELAQELERSKQEAVHREDYEEAQRIKAKMDELLLNPRKRQTGAAAASPSTPASTAAYTASAHRRHTSGSSSSLPQPVSASSSSSRKSPSAFRSASPPVPAVLAAAAAAGSRAAKSPTAPSQSEDASAPVGFWNPGNEQSLVAEGLEPSLRASEEVRAMTQTFGSYLPRCLYSAHVELRVAGLDKVKHSLGGGIRDLSAWLFAAGVGLNEPNTPAVFAKAVEVMAKVMDLVSVEQLCQHPYLETTLFPRLLDALVVSTAQSSASGLLLRLGRQVLGLERAARWITSQPHTKRHAASTLFKPFLARLQLLVALVRGNGGNNGSEAVDPLPVLEWIKNNNLFSHANDKIQQLCVELTALLYGKSTPVRQREIKLFLQDALPRAQQVAQYTTALQAMASSAPATLPQPSSPSSSASSSLCVFCNKAGFTSEDELDLHMWKDCAVLSACPHCNQVIEVSKLNDHLLKECEHRGNHRACPRCHEAIAVALWDKHVKRNACLVHKPESDANRCPLCHNDVYPGEAGWRVHLLRDLCPNNSRTSDSGNGGGAQ